MFRKFGHRGAPGWPRRGENTISSFNRALELGADALEFDVRPTQDEMLVVIHDLAVDRTTNGHGNVSDMTSAELRELDAGGDCIPSLEEVFDNFGGHCLLNIELKENGLANLVQGMVLEREIENSVIISAFDSDDNDPDSNSSWDDLADCPYEVKTAFLATNKKIQKMGEREYIETAVLRGASAIHPEAKAVTLSLIQIAHTMKLYVNVWTVNQPREILRFKAMGVDGLISDFPDRL